MKVIRVSSCRDCPYKHYEEDGTFYCYRKAWSKLITKHVNNNLMPVWCTLEDCHD